MPTKNYLNQIICGNSLEVLKDLDQNSVDVILTDPPYFLDKLDNNWNTQKVSSKSNQKVIKSLPSGMKFDRQQGIEFYNWYLQVSKELFRVLKPGGFFFSFSSPRLYHRMASSMDDAGFEIRDMFMWLYTQNQVKAMSLNHFIGKSNISEIEKKLLKEKLKGWKTPQIKSCFEPIAMGQKPTEGTFLKNIQNNEVGLLNTGLKIGKNQDMQPANVFSFEEISEIIDRVFLINKPNKKEKGFFNSHKTVKPLGICEYLIQLSAFLDKAIILDPFAGSGTTCVAAQKLNKNFIGIDLNQEYVEISKKRLDFLEQKLEFSLF
jgi:site-specific DNA-methyltransferase (adenine-specific)